MHTDWITAPQGPLLAHMDDMANGILSLFVSLLTAFIGLMYAAFSSGRNAENVQNWRWNLMALNFVVALWIMSSSLSHLDSWSTLVERGLFLPLNVLACVVLLLPMLRDRRTSSWSSQLSGSDEPPREDEGRGPQ